MNFQWIRGVRTATIVAAALVLGAAATPRAQTTDVASLAGTWTLDRTKLPSATSAQTLQMNSDTMSDTQVKQLKEVSRVIGQAAGQLQITVTPTAVTINGITSQTFTLDGKKQDIQIGTVKIGGKTKWDKNQLKQELDIADAKLTRTWQVSADGKELTFASKLEQA